MTRTFFAAPLEGTATFWQILRRDGVALGFTSHDRDLALGSLTLRAAPGMLPAAIRRTDGFAPDSSEIRGALAHDAIGAADLAAGKFDGAQVASGIIDWETGEFAVLYRGTMGEVTQEGAGFEAQLLSAKSALAHDDIPRTSPTCRAAFCSAECGVDPARHSCEARLVALDLDRNAMQIVQVGTAFAASDFRHGLVCWFDGPHAGMRMDVIDVVDGDWLVLDRPLAETLQPGTAARMRLGCDHTIATCHARFSNSANFRGEPFVPGNDMLTRYPIGR